jgi:hypothetical protein
MADEKKFLVERLTEPKKGGTPRNPPKTPKNPKNGTFRFGKFHFLIGGGTPGLSF